MEKIKKISKKIILGFFSLVFALCGSAVSYAAGEEVGFGVSPMNQKIILTPGKIYRGTFKVTNPAKNTKDFNYKVSVGPFYVNDDYDIYYDNNGSYNQIVDWITLDKTEGTISPNNTEEIRFSIDVPKDAPAGGQYAAIRVSSNDESNPFNGGVNIQEGYAIAHIVYAEIAGTTKRSGEITDVNISPFLFSGNINATASIKNTGNVHGDATYKLQVFPLFSDEEVYTNEEKPEEKTILPDRTLMNTSYWYETPKVGIFKVIYTAEFEGVTSTTEKMVIVCPLWLLFVILVIVFGIIFWLFSRNKKRKK